MTKGLMERSLHHEMTLGRVLEKAKLAEEELFELKNWKVVTEQKLKFAERARDEFQKMTEELKKVLEDKENDLRQAKALYPKLDFSSVNITVAEATSVYPDQSDDMNELFGEEVPVSVAPEIPTIEEEKAREAKDSAAPDV